MNSKNSSGESWRSSLAGALLSVAEAEAAPLRAAHGGVDSDSDSDGDSGSEAVSGEVRAIAC